MYIKPISDDCNIKPKLIKPKLNSAKKNLTSESTLPSKKINGCSVKQIPTNCLGVLKDDKWVGLMAELCSVGSTVCSLAGATSSVPYLNMITSPFTLYHNVKDCQEKYQLVQSAYKTSRFADLFFWGGKGIGSVACAISDVLRPIAGLITLCGWAQLPAVSLIFSFILPLFLLVLTAIGGASQVWALKRSAVAFHKFNQRYKGVDGSLERLEDFMSHFKVDEESHDLTKRLKGKNMSDQYFLSSMRQRIMHQRVEGFLNSDSEAIQASVATLIPLLNQGKQVFLESSQPEGSDFQRLDKTIALCEQLLAQMSQWKTLDAPVQLMIEELKRGLGELVKTKQNLHQKGTEIADSIRVEITRKLTEQSLYLLSSIISIITSILFLSFPQCKIAAYAISISGSALCVTGIVLNKSAQYHSQLD